MNFIIHFPHGANGKPEEIAGSRCPFAAVGDSFCVIFACLHSGMRLGCSGLAPRDACPLAGGNDVIVSMGGRSKIAPNVEREPLILN